MGNGQCAIAVETPCGVSEITAAEGRVFPMAIFDSIHNSRLLHCRLHTPLFIGLTCLSIRPQGGLRSRPICYLLSAISAADGRVYPEYLY